MRATDFLVALLVALVVLAVPRPDLAPPQTAAPAASASGLLHVRADLGDPAPL